ncbi:putative glycoside hydrolase [Nocardioides sp.]|uniref:putative glycoside hydrolase n=1 Tax=Nocardioides sp. TaxID=35761 RepID=UPI0035650B4F
MRVHTIARFTCLLSAVALLLLAAYTPSRANAVVASAPSNAGGAPERPGGVALTWAPTYMSNDHSYTRARAVEVAREFDLVAGMPIAFQHHVDAMRAANPDLTLIAYANATHAQTYEVGGLPEAAFAHDLSGSRIRIPAWGTFLMESSNPRWRQAADYQCNDRATRGGYDGCLVDMLTLGIFSRGYVTALPVNPSTGREYTEAEYRAEMIAMTRHYREHSPGMIHLGNAVENAYRYWQAPVTSRPLAAAMPGAQMEDFLRGADTPVGRYPDAVDWKRNVDVVRDLEDRGVTGLYSTKVWVGASEQQVRDWQSYSMASFLMGAAGNSYFAFTRSRDAAGATGANAPYTMPKEIGLPTGAMKQLANGAWTRPFANGLSVVNPTAGPVTIDLGSPLRRLDGTTVSSLTLPAHSGDVLVGESSTPPPPDPPADPDPETDPETDPDPEGDPDPELEDAAPTGAFTKVFQRGRKLIIRGTAQDDVAVTSVSIAIRHEGTLKWRRADRTWGNYQLLATRLRANSPEGQRWSRRIRLPRGSYGISLVVEDSAGAQNSAPRPWKVVEVRKARRSR